MKFSVFWEHLVCIFFPERCIFCNEVIPACELTCDHCFAGLSVITPPVCPNCGCRKADCECGHRHRSFDRVVAPFYYIHSIRLGILRLKKHDDQHAIAFFAHQMVAALRREIPDSSFDAVCYVPMTEKDQYERNYNQGELLARQVAGELGLPVSHLLIKIQETDYQKTMKRNERAGNVLGAFDVRAGESVGKSLLLVDDLMTTGSTVAECAKMLKIYGAATVTVLTIAVTPPQGNNDEKNDPVD